VAKVVKFAGATVKWTSFSPGRRCAVARHRLRW